MAIVHRSVTFNSSCPLFTGFGQTPLHEHVVRRVQHRTRTCCTTYFATNEHVAQLVRLVASLLRAKHARLVKRACLARNKLMTVQVVVQQIRLLCNMLYTKFVGDSATSELVVQDVRVVEFDRCYTFLGISAIAVIT